MEILSCVEFVMPTDNDYKLMQSIIKNIYDNYDNRWDAVDNNPETRTIKFEDVFATQDNVVALVRQGIEKTIEYLLQDAPIEIKNIISEFSYIMHGWTSNGGYEEIDYIIKRKGDKLTMKSSSFFFEDYNDCEDDDECMQAYEDWQDNPDYDPEIDLKNDYLKTHDIININDQIRECLKSNNLPYDEKDIDKLNVNDVYNIISKIKE